MRVHLLPAFKDNYIFVIENQLQQSCAVVDPGDSDVVLNWLSQTNLSVESILVTHRHPDHIEGLEELRKKTGAVVYGPELEASSIPNLDFLLKHNQNINCLNQKVHILDLSGHTKGQIGYFFGQMQKPILFCGDALFSLGCGRLFDGTFEQMFHTMLRLKELPPHTLIYCAHEYTLMNSKFALSMDSENLDLVQYVEEVQKLRSRGKPTIPVSLSTEIRCNPFLRFQSEKIKSHLNKSSVSDFETFKLLRQARDNW